MRFSVSFFLILSLIRCSENSGDDRLTLTEKLACIKVSYVAGICGQVALKIEDPRYFALGEDWKEHKNVFYTRLPCNAPADIEQRPFFFVRLLEEEALGSCMVCQALFNYSGNKRYNIQIVDVCNN
jgi:hypothetical protein